MSEEIKIEQRESIKLIKMSKGYNWEIKILPENSLIDEDLERLKHLNEKMQQDYGTE
jgi:hypothetical protein